MSYLYTKLYVKNFVSEKPIGEGVGVAVLLSCLCVKSNKSTENQHVECAKQKSQKISQLVNRVLQMISGIDSSRWRGWVMIYDGIPFAKPPVTNWKARVWGAGAVTDKATTREVTNGISDGGDS